MVDLKKVRKDKDVPLATNEILVNTIVFLVMGS